MEMGLNARPFSIHADSSVVVLQSMEAWLGDGEALSPAKSVEGGPENNTNFVLKLQYNKDEELITIIRVTTLGNAYNWLSK